MEEYKPVITLIIVNEAYKDEFDSLSLQIREIAKKSMLSYWPFVDALPIKISIGGCEVRTEKLLK